MVFNQTDIADYVVSALKCYFSQQLHRQTNQNLFLFSLFFSSLLPSMLSSQVRSAVRKRWHRWQDKHSIRARVARAMSIPTSPTRVSFHSIKQSSAVWGPTKLCFGWKPPSNLSPPTTPPTCPPQSTSFPSSLQTNRGKQLPWWFTQGTLGL